MGTDAALGLAMAQVIISENLFKADYVHEQTDLPFLIRDDTKRYLRQSDVQAKGEGRRLLLLGRGDEAGSPRRRAVRGQWTQDLRLGAIKPALHGRVLGHSWPTARRSQVRPLLDVLADHLQQYTPEKCRDDHRGQRRRRSARSPAAWRRRRPAMIFASWGACKHYHSDLVQRAMCLLMALTGNQGKRGGGIRPGALVQHRRAERDLQRGRDALLPASCCIEAHVAEDARLRGLHGPSTRASGRSRRRCRSSTSTAA